MLKAWKVGGQEKQQALLTVLFKGFFEELVNVGDTDVLADAAVSADLMTKDEVCVCQISTDSVACVTDLIFPKAIKFLESDECLDEVETMMTEARRKGVNGVPFVVIDGKWAVSGGQTSEVYTQVRFLRYSYRAHVGLNALISDIQKAGIERDVNTSTKTCSTTIDGRAGHSMIVRRHWSPLTVVSCVYQRWPSSAPICCRALLFSSLSRTGSSSTFS